MSMLRRGAAFAPFRALLWLTVGVFGFEPALAQPFQVNTDTSGAQIAPAVASNASGAFVATWQVSRPPGSATPSGILARRFGSDGAPLGNDFAVNSTTTGFHGDPVVAMAPDGSFVIAWRTFISFFDPDSYEIRARRFDAGGNPLGPDFSVNSHTPGIQQSPAIAMLTGGGFVIVWDGPGPTPGDDIDVNIQVRRYSASGVAQGVETRANANRDGAQTNPGVAASSDGGFWVVWSGPSLGTDQSFTSIQGRRFGSNGQPTGGDFQVNSHTSGTQRSVAIASAANGKVIVTWQSSTSAGTDSSQASVHAQLFDASGAAIGGESQVNTATQGNQDAPTAAFGSDGEAFVAWHSLDNPLVGNHQIRARTIRDDGVPQGQDFRVDGSGSGLRQEPAAMALAGGDFGLLWASGALNQDTNSIRANLLTGDCTPGPTRLCLGDGRFLVETQWRTTAGATGTGMATQLTRDTGYFYFFNPANVEMVLKVLDACSLNQRYWVFAAGITDVEVDITVTDIIAGSSKTYRNPLGTPFAPIQDTNALATCNGAASTTEGLTLGEEWELREETIAELDEALDLAERGADDTFLLLNNGRFRVSINWQTSQGASGVGHGVQLTGDTGYFWFFNSQNVEVIIKVLNACGLNQRFWVFSGGLTNVRAEIRVEDTANGTVKTYLNPLNRPFQPILDTGAFATCP